MFESYHLADNARIVTKKIPGPKSVELLEAQEELESNNRADSSGKIIFSKKILDFAEKIFNLLARICKAYFLRRSARKYESHKNENIF